MASFNSPLFNDSEFNGDGSGGTPSGGFSGQRADDSGQQGGPSQKPESENKQASKNAVIAFCEESLKSLLREVVHGDIDTERTRQLQLADKYDKYMRGKQFLYPNGTGAGETLFNSQGVPDGISQTDIDGWLDYVYNLTADLGRKFRGVLGMKGPRVKAVADDADSPNDKAAKVQGDLAAKKLLADWDYDGKQSELALLLWQSGTTFGYARYVADEERYGQTTVPKVEIREVTISPAGYICPQCGVRSAEQQVQGATCPNCGAELGPGNYVEADTVPVPQFTTSVTYPNGKVALDLCDVTTVATPYTAKDCSDTPWLYYRFEEHKSRLLAVYPELREKIGDNSASALGTADGSSEAGIQVRDAAASPSALGTNRRQNRWTFTRYWIRRYVFEQVKDDKVRAYLKQQYPSGLKIVMVGDQIVDLVEERLDSVWSVCKPEASKYIWCDAYCRDVVALNDPINDAINILIETLERGIPLTFMDPQQVDPSSIDGRSAKPAEIKWVKPGVGSNLLVQTLKTADLPDGLIPAIEFIVAKAQQVVGITPSIFGGDGGKDQTFRGQLLKRNQALMQLAECWSNMCRFAQDTFKNGALQLDKYSPEDQIRIPGMSAEPGGEAPMIKRGVMSQGSFHYEAEPSIPMTHGEQRDQFTDLLQNPMVAQSMGLFDIPNRAKANDLIGFPELVVPGADLRQVIETTIQDMLRKKEVPVMAPDPMTRQVVQQPSREPERNIDPQAATVVINELLLTPPIRALFGTPEYENLVLLWDAYRKAGQPPPPPPGAPPVPQGPPKGKPGRPPMMGAKPGPGFGVPPAPGGIPQSNPLAPAVQ